MRDSHEEIDRLLDSALATYADPGTDSGLERRILNRLAAESAPAPRRRWLPWAVALTAATALLLIVLLSIPKANRLPAAPQEARHAQQPPAASSEAANQPASRPAPILRAPYRRSHARRVVLEARPAPLPKLEMFPTPQPLSPQERALANFAAQATKSERESLLAAQSQADAPLHIAAIEITPLEPPAAGAN